MALVAAGCSGRGATPTPAALSSRSASPTASSPTRTPRHRLRITVAGYTWAIYEPLMQTNDDTPTDPVTPWLAIGGVERRLHRGGHHRSRGREVVGRRGLHRRRHRLHVSVRKDNPELNADFPDITAHAVDGGRYVNFTSGEFVNQGSSTGC